jgi:hypothetical protein
MSNGLNQGNVVVAPGSYQGQYTTPIPGYRFYQVAGYVALAAELGNKFAVWVPSQERKHPRKRLSLPWGATVHHVGMRVGRGFWSEGAQNLALTLVDNGVPNPAAALPLGPIAGSAGRITEQWKILGPAGGNEISSQTTLLRGARPVNPFNPARLDAFNSVIATQYIAGIGTDDQFDQLNYDLRKSVQLELQCRSGVAPGAPLQPVGVGTGGLRQNLDPKYHNQAYGLIQIGFYMISPDVVTAEDFGGVVWDEVFANNG